MAKILLVEDEQIIRLLHKRWLESHGHSVVDFGNVDDTIEYLKQEAAGQVDRIDLLLLDIELGNGKHGRFSGLKILPHVPPRIQRVVISGYSPEHVREHVDPLTSVQFYFSKPMTDEEKQRLLILVQVAARQSISDRDP